jgi:hypothetical protein
LSKQEEPVFCIDEAKGIKFPQHGCPACGYYSESFPKTTRHIDNAKHYYQGYGTYPIFIQSLAQLVAMGYESFPKCKECREHIKELSRGCYIWQLAEKYCKECPLVNEANKS